MNTTGREVIAHLALALSRYERDARRDGLSVPPEVGAVAAWLIDCAQPRQTATPVGQCPECGHGEAMTDTLLLTKADAARTLRASVRSVERLIAAGTLPAIKVGGSTRVRRADLDTYVAALAPRSFRDNLNLKAGAA